MLAMIGSVAMKLNGLPPGREPMDIDFIGTPGEVVDWVKVNLPKVEKIYPTASGNKIIAKGWDEYGHRQIVESEVAWEDSTGASLIADILPYNAHEHSEGVVFPNLDVLLMLKLSHRYLKDSPHFLKTMRDIHKLRAAGAIMQPEWKVWFKQREKETYTYKHPKLNVSKQDFFKGDGVQYVYDHDSIHRAVKHLEQPAYTYFKPDRSEVFCDREMFEAAPKVVRLLSVLEESYVLALERSLVPFKGQTTPEWAFKKALEKVCTSITSGWWREFAWENYDAVLALYDESFHTRFWEAVQRGQVPLHKEN
jgi:hypothetical protein